jgi:hypothetical protein
LNRVSQEVTVKEPVVETDVALRDDAPAIPPSRDVTDTIDHEHRRKRKASLVVRRAVLDEPAVRQGEYLFL